MSIVSSISLYIISLITTPRVYSLQTLSSSSSRPMACVLSNHDPLNYSVTSHVTNANFAPRCQIILMCLPRVLVRSLYESLRRPLAFSLFALVIIGRSVPQLIEALSVFLLNLCRLGTVFVWPKHLQLQARVVSQNDPFWVAKLVRFEPSQVVRHRRRD